MGVEIENKSSIDVSEERPATPERVRQLLERLGPTFVKLGQYLALHPELIAPEFRDEFFGLTDGVPPLSLTEVRNILSDDLGVDSPEELFSWINPHPLFSAAIGQVHLARTMKADPVAIKVRRPGIHKLVERDLGQVHAIERILEMTGASSRDSSFEILEDFRGWMRNQLDFRLELRNLTRLSNLSRGIDSCRIPRPYPALSGGSVLSSEYFPGIPLVEVMALVRAENRGRLQSLNLDAKEVAANLQTAVVDQIFRVEFFQSDFHPANILVLPGSGIGFLNYCETGILEPYYRPAMLRFLSSVSSGDLDRAFDGLSELLVSSARSDRNRQRVDFFEQYSRRDAPTEDSPASIYLIAFLRSARRNHFSVPPSIRSLCCAMVIAETLAGQLGGTPNLATKSKPLLDQLQLHSMLDSFRRDNLQSVVLDGLRLISDGPRNIRRLLADVVDGRLVLRVRTVESDEDRQRSNVRTRLVSMSIVSVGLTFLLFATKGYMLFRTIPLSWFLWTALALIWAWIAFLSRDLQ